MTFAPPSRGRFEAGLALLLAVGLLARPLLAGFGSSEPLAAPEIENAPPDQSVAAPEGHLLVQWEYPPSAAEIAFELQQDVDPRFPQPVSRRVGTDTASVLSGLPQGDVYVRVRAVGERGEKGPWSRPLQVDVSYPPAAWLGILMSLGIVLFASTVLLIWRGHRRSQLQGHPSR